MYGAMGVMGAGAVWVLGRLFFFFILIRIELIIKIDLAGND